MDPADIGMASAVAVHSCGHVSISFAHLRPEDVGRLVDVIAEQPEAFKTVLLDQVSAAIAMSTFGVPDPQRFEDGSQDG